MMWGPRRALYGRRAYLPVGSYRYRFRPTDSGTILHEHHRLHDITMDTVIQAGSGYRGQRGNPCGMKICLDSVVTGSRDQ